MEPGKPGMVGRGGMAPVAEAPEGGAAAAEAEAPIGAVPIGAAPLGEGESAIVEMRLMSWT